MKIVLCERGWATDSWHPWCEWVTLCCRG